MQSVQADAIDGTRAITWVKMAFAEDYMQHHGRNIKSFYVSIRNTDPPELLDLVPTGRRFIITDVYVSNGGFIDLSTSESSSGILFRGAAQGEDKFYNFNSGIIFNEGESIYCFTTNTNILQASISGYYVDMPQP